MAYEHRDNTATLFPNRDRKTDNQPNAKGEGVINGVPVWVSAWTKRDKNGNPWQSLSFTPKDDTAARPKPQQSPAAQEFDDEIPF
jgi:hypothetical protein